MAHKEGSILLHIHQANTSFAWNLILRGSCRLVGVSWWVHASHVLADEQGISTIQAWRWYAEPLRLDWLGTY